jgi:hypothetical protein
MKVNEFELHTDSLKQGFSVSVLGAPKRRESLL